MTLRTVFKLKAKYFTKNADEELNMSGVPLRVYSGMF